MEKLDFTQNLKEKSSLKVKDTLFRTLFGEKKRAIELCNALEGTNYPPDANASVINLESTMFRRFNDSILSIEDELLIFSEQQSTINLNMPLRLLSFVSDTLHTWYVTMKEVYKPKLYKIPTPKFYVVYNGREPLKQDVLRLTDAFKVEPGPYTLELTAKVLDVNYDRGNEILKKSPSLGGYAYLVELIRIYMQQGHTRDKAISMAIKQCIAEGILVDFLEKNFKEVSGMFALEYDPELERQALREHAWEEGREEGREEGLVEGLIKSAVKLLQKGYALNEVAQLLELSDAQIAQLDS